MRSFQDYWKKYAAWWQHQDTVAQWQIFGVLIATVLGAAYRLAYLPETLQFLGDQGRDAIIAYGILHGDFTLVGPSTSVGSMFLGPLYYYFMAPWLLLSGFNPLGPAYAIAFIGILTVPLMYVVGKKLIGGAPAFLATLLYTFAPYVLVYTRFSWNPNPAPIITLAMLYAGWKAWKGSAWWWVGVALGWLIMIQLHYVALLSAVPFGLFWLFDLRRSLQAKDQARLLILGKTLLASLGLLFLSLVPLILFDFRFHHVIVKGFVDFLDGDPTAEKLPLAQRVTAFFREHQGRGMHVLFEIWGAEWTQWYRQINSSLLSAYGLFLALLWPWYRRSKFHSGFWLIVLFFLTSLSGLATYSGTLHHHYITYLYPISYYVSGLVMYSMVKNLRWLGVVLASLLFIYISWIQVQPAQMSYLQPMGWQITDMKRVAKIIQDRLPKDKTYTLASLSEFRDYRGMNYRYFLVASDHPPVALEEFAQADLLVVVAENPTQPELVLNSPAYEIQDYPRGGWEKIDLENGPSLYFIGRQTTQ